MYKRLKKLYTISCLLILFSSFLPLRYVIASEEPIFVLIRKAEDKAYSQRMEAEARARILDDYYNNGKDSYYSGDYSDAIAEFDELLKLEPNYEPAKLYRKCAIIHYKISLEEGKIRSSKLKMADITAEYDVRIQNAEGLAFGYLLEQALLRCQASDYKGAEYYYNLCYRLDPRSKDRIEWFVNATYELKDLADILDECYKRIEEMPELTDSNLID